MEEEEEEEEEEDCGYEGDRRAESVDKAKRYLGYLVLPLPAHVPILFIAACTPAARAPLCVLRIDLRQHRSRSAFPPSIPHHGREGKSL